MRVKTRTAEDTVTETEQSQSPETTLVETEQSQAAKSGREIAREQRAAGDAIKARVREYRTGTDEQAARLERADVEACRVRLGRDARR
jgi:hypothetical protein